MRKIKAILLTLFLSISFTAPANAISILPEFDEDVFFEIAESDAEKIYNGYTNESGKKVAPDSNRACKVMIDERLSNYTQDGLVGEDAVKAYLATSEDKYTETFLACAVKSGNIKFWMVPFYARHVLSFLLGIAGLISVLMIIVGAYYYIAGGISEDKEKGKNVIKFALGGLVLTTLAWIIVNFILLLLTA